MADLVTPEPRLPWHNPHDRPSDAALSAHYAEPLPDLLARARERLRTNAAPPATITESMGWHGLPWRWSWVYRIMSADKAGGARELDERGLAYVIPAVAAPIVCVPLSYDMFESMPKSIATPFIREGITLGKEIGEYRWPEWSITLPAHLDEALAVAAHKAAFLSGHTGKPGE